MRALGARWHPLAMCCSPSRQWKDSTSAFPLRQPPPFVGPFAVVWHIHTGSPSVVAARSQYFSMVEYLPRFSRTFWLVAYLILLCTKPSLSDRVRLIFGIRWAVVERTEFELHSVHPHITRLAQRSLPAVLTVLHSSLVSCDFKV